jgi:hypothetical protein
MSDLLSETVLTATNTAKAFNSKQNIEKGKRDMDKSVQETSK